MSFLRNRLVRRFSFIGRVADLALVGGMALRFAHRQGWIDLDGSNEFGPDPEADTQPFGAAELVLAGAALVRLLRRKKR